MTSPIHSAALTGYVLTKFWGCLQQNSISSKCNKLKKGTQILCCQTETLKVVLSSLNLAALMFLCPFAQMTTVHNAQCIAAPSSIACSPILEDQAICGECQSKETLGRLYICHNQIPSSQYFCYSDLGFNDTFWNDLPLKCCIVYQEE